MLAVKDRAAGRALFLSSFQFINVYFKSCILSSIINLRDLQYDSLLWIRLLNVKVEVCQKPNLRF